MKHDKKTYTPGNIASGDQPANNNSLSKPRLRPLEKHCPRCSHLLVLNELEGCIECHQCGYIDCGDDDES